jgi:broad specificity phosphatase PhoE
LNSDPEWHRFNASRSSVRAPGGELMIETQTRMVSEIEDLRREHDGQTIAIVSHGDPLRSVVAHYLGAPLDLLARFEIDPGSATIMQCCGEATRILCLNHTGELPL